MAEATITVNRAPVLALWAAVVAERLGQPWPAALSMGKVLAGLNAQSKGRRLGVFGPPHAAEEEAGRQHGRGEDHWVELCGRAIPCRHTPEGVRGVVGEDPVDPAAVEKYLQGKLGEAYPVVLAAFRELAAAYEPAELAEAAYGLYERFRPQIDPGVRGWGQKGTLDLALVRGLTSREGQAGR